jgi:hypothetical protein
VPALVLLALACADKADDRSSGGFMSEGVTLGDPVACDAPADRPSWTDQAEARGLLGTDLSVHTMGGVAVVYDLDADGDLDMVLRYVDETRFYLREDERYTMQSLASQADVRLLSVADLGLGYVEVLSGAGQVYAWRVADGTIEQRFVIADGDERLAHPAQGVFPADIDEDGVMDVYAMQTDPGLEDMLWWGNGDGSFTPEDESLPASTRSGWGFDAHWFDYDRDLDLDLYVANDRGYDDGPNVLYRNDDGVLTDVSEACRCDLAVAAMGADSGDFDQDGWPDLYVSISGNQSLLQSAGDGSFIDVTRSVGIPAQGKHDMGWGAVFLDLENDGDLDIFEARGDLWSDSETAPVFDSAPRLLQNDDGAFSDVATDWGLDPEGSWRAIVPYDYNGDGVLDLLLTDVIARPKLWISDSCTADGWLDVEAPVGAAVEVEAGGRTQTAWVTTQSGMGGVRPPIAHFGLGSATAVDRLTVTGLDGTVWKVTEPFEGRRKVVVAPP